MFPGHVASAYLPVGFARSCHSHQRLAEVLSSVVKERCRRLFHSVDSVFFILRRPVRTHSPTSRKNSACFTANSETMNPRRRRRLRNTENMSGPALGSSSCLPRWSCIRECAQKIVEQRPPGLLDRSADVLKIKMLNALGTSGFELFYKIRRAMIDASIEAQFAGDKATFLKAAGDFNRQVPFHFGDLPDYRPDGTRSGRFSHKNFG